MMDLQAILLLLMLLVVCQIAQLLIQSGLVQLEILILDQTALQYVETDLKSGLKHVMTITPLKLTAVMLYVLAILPAGIVLEEVQPQNRIVVLFVEILE